MAVKSNTHRIIKCYSNRKLYDTSASSYITLEDIAHFIREGEDVTVMDNESGKDITSQTLTQIIFENERRSKRELPRQFLKEIIQNKGGSISSFFQRKVIEPVSQVGSNAGHVIKDVAGGIEDWQKKIDHHVRSTVAQVTGIQELRRRIGVLNQKVRYLEKKVGEYKSTQP
ncbi:MAG: polyhydroxyalkanoate synthesis regulator DNA-binding domain-containing protein [Deltaproteobacteria bacterium]|nr:polyhydroxyalkanoate synthesis regulator DNA-binding domain-containing protein [Deltaproteobacteria bacterium]